MCQSVSKERNSMTLHRVFISYHHGNDQCYKNSLLYLNIWFKIFIDESVDTGGISEELPDQSIRAKIRDEYLRNTTVTILLCGTETKGRKHCDWELYSSMFNGKINKQSGILVILLPSVDRGQVLCGHGQFERSEAFSDISTWSSVWRRSDLDQFFPYLPERITDNLESRQANISIVGWNRIYYNPRLLRDLIGMTAANRLSAKYDLSRPMRRSCSPRRNCSPGLSPEQSLLSGQSAMTGGLGNSLAPVASLSSLGRYTVPNVLRDQCTRSTGGGLADSFHPNLLEPHNIGLEPPTRPLLDQRKHK